MAVGHALPHTHQAENNMFYLQVQIQSVGTLQNFRLSSTSSGERATTLAKGVLCQKAKGQLSRRKPQIQSLHCFANVPL